MAELEYSENTSFAELKRADHLFWVTLKYTRTVDVIKNIISRLLHSIELAINELFDKKKMKASPVTGIEKLKLLEQKIQLKEIKELSYYYYYLRELDKSKYSVKEEYRKGVAMVTPEEIITIERLKEIFIKVKELVEFVNRY